jgi:hypothetical protein
MQRAYALCLQMTLLHNKLLRVALGRPCHNENRSCCCHFLVQASSREAILVPSQSQNPFLTCHCYFASDIQPTTIIMSEEMFVPLNDTPKMSKMKKSTSRGSDVNLMNQGMEDTLDFRMHASCPESGKQISLWHDISLYHIDPATGKESSALNFVCEIPKFSRYDRNVDCVTCMTVIFDPSPHTALLCIAM